MKSDSSQYLGTKAVDITGQLPRPLQHRLRGAGAVCGRGRGQKLAGGRGHKAVYIYQ